MSTQAGLGCGGVMLTQAGLGCGGVMSTQAGLGCGKSLQFDTCGFFAFFFI